MPKIGVLQRVTHFFAMLKKGKVSSYIVAWAKLLYSVATAAARDKCHFAQWKDSWSHKGILIILWRKENTFEKKIPVKYPNLFSNYNIWKIY